MRNQLLYSPFCLFFLSSFLLQDFFQINQTLQEAYLKICHLSSLISLQGKAQKESRILNQLQDEYSSNFFLNLKACLSQPKLPQYSWYLRDILRISDLFFSKLFLFLES